jgi:hypothetical protein
MRLGQIAYGVMQIAIVGATFVFFTETHSETPVAAALIIGAALAAIATGIIYWSLEGIRWLRAALSQARW